MSVAPGWTRPGLGERLENGESHEFGGTGQPVRDLDGSLVKPRDVNDREVDLTRRCL